MSVIKEKISKLPMCPGVYIMKNSEGEIIYVGKSKALKNRVSQYFQNSQSHTLKTKLMVENIADFEYIITDTEPEALALECNLIKKHKPKYNILLKDDKQYPYIKITANEEFPRIMLTRQLKKDGGIYFGPYMNTLHVREALEEIRKTFKIRSCKKQLSKDSNGGRPCLYYQIGQCSAPCAGRITPEEYNETLSEISNVLNGNYKELVADLNQKMLNASDNLEFEKAAQYRDKISGIKTLGEKQKITSTKGDNMDVIGVFEDEGEYCIQVFYYRDGKAVGSEYFTLESENTLQDEMVENFVKQFYFTSNKIPREILVPCTFDDISGIEEWLSLTAGHKVSFSVPQRGKKRAIMDMVLRNAEESLRKDRFIKNKSESYKNSILSQLMELLELDVTPHRIESYDISNISGTSSVGVQIVYDNASPKNGLYRKYNIKNVEGADDYESMREIIFRRITEAYKEEDAIKSGDLEPEKAKFLPLPDLILLDGGKGHVSAIKTLFETLGEDIPVFGLVKDNSHRTRGVTDENREYYIDKHSELFRFLANMQEEVHRYAINAHRKRHEKTAVKSVLENIDGVGSKTAKKLLEHFGGINKIKTAGVDELRKVAGSRAAENIYNFFKKEK